MSLLFLITSLAFSFSVLASNKSCSEFYDLNLKSKNIKLFSYHETKSLCAFEMAENVSALNLMNLAPEQKLSKKELKTFGFKGRWKNIFSKDQSKDVLGVPLSSLVEGHNCIVSHPVAHTIECPKHGIDVLKVILKHLNEKATHSVAK